MRELDAATTLWTTCIGWPGFQSQHWLEQIGGAGLASDRPCPRGQKMASAWTTKNLNYMHQFDSPGKAHAPCGQLELLVS